MHGIKYLIMIIIMIMIINVSSRKTDYRDTIGAQLQLVARFTRT